VENVPERCEETVPFPPDDRDFDNDQDIERDLKREEARHQMVGEIEQAVLSNRDKWEKLDALILHAWIHDPTRMKVALMYLNSMISEDDRHMVERILRGETKVQP
jgi:hypothetical protein